MQLSKFNLQIIFIFGVYFTFGNLFSQTSDSTESNSYYPYVKDINFASGDYTFQTQYDTSNWCSILKVNFKGKEIANSSFDGWVDTINTYDFNGNGKKNVLIGSYTGGAHCCVMIFIGVMENGRFNIPDTLFLGNAGFNILDLDKDGKLEIASASDMFAYAFTNYAETRFSPRIYRIVNNKFKDVTKDYPKVVNSYIEELKNDLKEFTDKEFECYGINDDTFNTDAGSVKTILAAITACYHSIGEVKKGYELIDKSYKCPDKNKFVKILKNEYKLK
jgi:hypothetical protein